MSNDLGSVATLPASDLADLVRSLAAAGRARDIEAVVRQRPSVLAQSWFAETVPPSVAHRAVAAWSDHQIGLTTADVENASTEQLALYAASAIVSPGIMAAILRFNADDDELRHACIVSFERFGTSIAAMNVVAMALSAALVSEKSGIWRGRIQKLHRYHRVVS